MKTVFLNAYPPHSDEKLSQYPALVLSEHEGLADLLVINADAETVTFVKGATEGTGKHQYQTTAVKPAVKEGE